MIEDRFTNRVIGLAIDVHRTYGPGLLESAYEDCLCIELAEAGIPFARQVPISTIHKGHIIANTYRADIVVGDDLILEIKAVDKIVPLHEAQMLTYLRLSGRRIGLLFNFNTLRLKEVRGAKPVAPYCDPVMVGLDPTTPCGTEV